MRGRVAESARGFGDAARVDSLLAEAAPFVEAARRAQGVHGVAAGVDASSMGWREARSLAWLLGYRLGDQASPAAVAAAVAPAWRDATGAPVSAGDEVGALVLDGFVRGREDRLKLDAGAALSAAMPVLELVPGVVVTVASGALDAEGARALADRASSRVLRSDARAAVLDVSGLTNASAAVLSELWGLAAAARMLGVPLYVSGVQGPVREALEAAGLATEGETRVETAREALAFATATTATTEPSRRGEGEIDAVHEARASNESGAQGAGIERLVAWVRKVFARGG